MRKSWVGLGILLAASVFAGCGEKAEEPVNVSDGMRITSALAATDALEVKCSEDGQGQKIPVTARMRRTAGGVLFDADTGSQLTRSPGSKPSTSLWVAKVPLAVRMGTKPVELAVMKDDGAGARLQYVDGGEPTDANTARRITLLPCGDESPVWRGYAGAIVSENKPGCVEIVDRVEGGTPSVNAVAVTAACDDE